jgi:hypothetical protein
MLVHRTVRATLVALSLVPVLAGCGNVAGADTPVAPPPLPAAPPLSEEAAQALAAPAPTVPPPPPLAQARQPMLWSALFDAASLGEWRVADVSEGPAGLATWRVEDGAAAQAGDADGLPDPGGSYLLGGDAAWRDYSMRADVFATDETQLGIVARQSDAGAYRLRLDAGHEAGALVLEAIGADGKARQLARSSVPATTNRWVALTLDVRGSRLIATLDGNVTLRADDAQLGVGGIGLFAQATGNARFDNVVVTQ